MSDLSRLDTIMSLTLEERGALITLQELAATRGGFVPEQERWLAGWLQCSVRKWRLIRSSLVLKGKLVEASRAGEKGFVFVSATNQSRLDDDSTTSHARKIVETKTKSNEINEGDPSRTGARDGDITSNSELVGGGGGGSAGEPVSDDWPEEPVDRLIEAAASPWLDLQKSHGLILSAPRLEAWKRRGAGWRSHVLPVVTTLARQATGPISSWKFFEPALGRAVKASRDELELPAGVVRMPSTGPPKSYDQQNAAMWDETMRRMAEGE